MRQLQPVILGALGVYLLYDLLAGTLQLYVHQSSAPLTWFAALTFLVLAVASGWARRDSHNDRGVERETTNSACAHSLTEPPEDPDTHGHAHGEEAPQASVWRWALVALPVFLGVLIPARPLGASAVAWRGVNTSTPVLAPAGDAGPIAAADIASTDRTIADWLRVVRYSPAPSVYQGQPADVIGFVYRDPELPAGQFLVSRFLIVHCTADALVIGMIVAAPDNTDWPDNTWVRVEGPVVPAELGGRRIPLIQAASIQTVPEPDEPYLYP